MSDGYMDDILTGLFIGYVSNQSYDMLKYILLYNQTYAISNIECMLVHLCVFVFGHC